MIPRCCSPVMCAPTGLKTGLYVYLLSAWTRKINQTLVTKGDANEVEDGPVAFSQVFGETKFHLPYLGYIAMNIKTPTGIMVVCGVLVVVILLNFIPAIIDAGEEDKKKALQAAESAEKGRIIAKERRKYQIHTML